MCPAVWPDEPTRASRNGRAVPDEANTLARALAAETHETLTDREVLCPQT